VQSRVLQVGVGTGDDDPTPEKFTVAKPWERPRPTQDCRRRKRKRMIISFSRNSLLRGVSYLVTNFSYKGAGMRSRYSDWLRAGRPRGRRSSPGRVKNFLFSTSSRPDLGPTQLPIQWVPRALSPGVKRPGSEANHPLRTSAEIKKMWIYTSTPAYSFLA
jgi:hypothetical protein